MAVHIKLIKNNIKSRSGYGGGRILYNFCDGVKTVWQKGFKP